MQDFRQACGGVGLTWYELGILKKAIREERRRHEKNAARALAKWGSDMDPEVRTAHDIKAALLSDMVAKLKAITREIETAGIDGADLAGCTISEKLKAPPVAYLTIFQSTKGE
tara:strand:- start:76 stop:414 length:339 start_codon:yes stop_codon:yes gene_type:complete